MTGPANQRRSRLAGVVLDWLTRFGLLVVCGVLAGCGGASRSRPASGAVLRPASGAVLRPASGAALRPASGAALRPASGAALFTERCGACHSLVGRESPRRQGGDLLRFRFSRETMLEFAREMPVRRPLDARELSAVVDYVVGVERTGRPRCAAPGC